MTRVFVGPPVRPRYRVLSLTGYPSGGPGSGWGRRSRTKERTTWAVHDHLRQGFAVTGELQTEAEAREIAAELESEWESWLRGIGMLDAE